MSFLPVIQYLCGIGVFGLMYWIMDPIVELFFTLDTGGPIDFLHLLWTAILLVYLVAGAYWLIRIYNRPQGGYY